MKKLLFGAAAFVALVLAALPFYTGHRAQIELEKLAAMISDAPGYEAIWEVYDKGWLGTEAVLRLSLPPESGIADNRLSLPISVSIGHGPLIFDEITSFGWFSFRTILSTEQASLLDEYVDHSAEGDLITTSGYTDLLASTHIEQVVLPFTYDLGDYRGSFAGASSINTIAASGKADYSVTIGEAELIGPNGLVVKMSAAAGDGEADFGHIASLYLIPGNFHLTIPSLVVQRAASDSAISNLSLSMLLELPEQSPTFDMAITAKVESAEIADYTVANATATLNYKNVSTALYLAYIEMSDELMQSANPQATPSEYLTNDMIDQALAFEPEFSITDMVFSGPNGQAEGELSWSLRALPGLGAEQMRQNPALLVAASEFKSDIAVDQALAISLLGRQMKSSINDQIRMQQQAGMDVQLSALEIDQMAADNTAATIDVFTEQGLATLTNGRYLSKILFRNNTLTINGQEAPLDALLPVAP